MNIRERIRMLANERGISLSQLESILGFGASTILKWDKSAPSVDKLEKVAEYFNVSVDYLLGKQKPEEDLGPYIGRIARAGKKLTKEQSESLLKYAKFMFPEAFDEEQQK